jgi:hypothetical protein
MMIWLLGKDLVMGIGSCPSHDIFAAAIFISKSKYQNKYRSGDVIDDITREL